MSLTPKMLSAAVLMALAGTAAAAPKDAAVAIALGQIKAHGAEFKAAAGDSFVVTDVIVGANGINHVRFDRTYNGLAVLGGDTIVHTYSNGQFKGASQTLSTNARPNLHANISSDQAITEAGVKFGTGFTGVPTSRLVVFARGKSPELAYEVVFSGVKADQTPTDMHYIVSAKNGRIMQQYDTVETAASAGTGKTLYSGTVALTTNSITGGFELRDPSRGNGYTVNAAKGKTSGAIFTDADNAWGSGSNADAATAAADAQYGVAKTWDFYLTNFNRSGIANDGKGAYNAVHYGRNYVNAYWSDSCFCMTYGDGDGINYGPLVNLDVAGHEMSHGVTSRTAKLVYSGESGGLNEANSDIMGTMVEFFANNSGDPGDYLIGEKIYLKYPAGNHALRYMFHPSLEGPSYSKDCWSSTLGSLDVHYSSGPANHFFYLLAEGSGAKTFNGVDHTSPTCNGSTVAGIGRGPAQQIWYRALTGYMVSSTNYAGARTATINAATEIYGAGSAEVNAVKAAWSAVNVN